ncbi:hypothetical protein FN846DRAFT_780359 [Sphaerosporella brunnea]|uniref:Fe2OG dioxygenase domain-containing protein n=1 Tax=Sphaerosporella brunnea TaxID=1250544 RepID=A0A5J5EUH7_9PEZI|nr:hypothetical protein FN846DRAFT_780359 [Sphaerosporella brunnea]
MYGTHLPAFPHCAFTSLIAQCLTPQECRSLLAFAGSHGEWEQALLSAYGGQKLDTSIRNSGRIMVDSRAVADQLFERVRPFLEAEGLHVIRTRGAGAWESMRSHWLGSTPFAATRLNERLRFLRYGPGQYFKPHCDGSYIAPETNERSLLTFHAYLGENGPGNEGGATSFFDGAGRKVMDVEPVQGRVLIFQHQWLVHSGEEVVKGLKYTVRTDIMYRSAPELEDEEEEGV